MDAPRGVYQWMYRGSAHHSVISGVLRSSGIGPVTRSTIDMVKYLPSVAREFQLSRLEGRGRRHGRRSMV
jgi:hypothetical protein